MDKSVLLGFSGGIDSCTAARKLKEMGYRVVALTIDTIGDEKMLTKAEASAHELDIEWLCYDAKELFQKSIVDYFCNEYRHGHTPAPCTKCNVDIKWKILLDQANKHNITHIATGHYFNTEVHNGKYYVAKGLDTNKDQSYYLWGLSQETLSRIITPMGDAIKSEVKRSFKDKSESMGICFLCGKHYADFLASQGVEMVEGDVMDECGMVCGSHNGIARYTIGQKRGVGIPEGKRVVDINARNNSIIVGSTSSLDKQTLYIENCNIVDEEELLSSTDITIKIRGIGRNPVNAVNVERYDKGYCIRCSDIAWAPAKGQPLVFYRDNLVIGGGIVVHFD